MRYVQEESLQEFFRPLGQISYTHLIALLRASTGLMNPSLFEGWSSVVEEAKSLGARAIVSDRPMHREQLGGGASYFDPRSEDQLADILQFASKLWLPGPRLETEMHAAAAMRSREAIFASAFEAAVARALD